MVSFCRDQKGSRAQAQHGQLRRTALATYVLQPAWRVARLSVLQNRQLRLSSCKPYHNGLRSPACGVHPGSFRDGVARYVVYGSEAWVCGDVLPHVHEPNRGIRKIHDVIYELHASTTHSGRISQYLHPQIVLNLFDGLRQTHAQWRCTCCMVTYKIAVAWQRTC